MRSYLQWPVATIAIVILSACGNNISVNDGNTTLNSPSTKSSNGNTNAKDNTDTAKGNTNTPRTVLCDIRYQGFRYGCVASSKTNRIWLDRNLGASRAATSLSDEGSYGYHFQWGRPKDGHQSVFSDKTDRRAATIHPSFSAFITVNNTTTDWVDDGVDDNGSKREAFLWGETKEIARTIRLTSTASGGIETPEDNGTGICPKGFRVPTAEELIRESYESDFDVTLKFPLAGFRNNTKNSIEVFKSASNGFLEDAFGYYMASDKFSNKMARTLSFDQDNTGKIETKSRSYGYSVRCIQKQKDEVVPSDDHGNLMDTATPIKLNNQTSGRINKAGDVDWFKIVISGTGILVVETTGTTDTEGFLYDAGGREIAFNDNISSSDNNFQISKFVTTGTYYVKVKHHTASSTGDYSLVSHLIADDYTNSRDDAGTISLASTTQGRINRAGDADWFKIVIPRTGTLVAKTVGLTDTKGSLYDASGTQIALDDNGGSGQNFKISKSITAAGTYYVKVKHSSVSSTGRYRLI
ncbi:MAG: fibrobacter succinogenes major paralogous domain-containing protein, partial [Sulfurovum sp.]|nr:fibrobacter succinogenes major paralogous domain-containing protein [Sulfurovum sp.]